MTSGTPRDIESIMQLGKSRDDLFAQLRARVMAQSGGHSRKQEEAFYNATRLFESVVWLVHRLGTSLSAVRRVAFGAQADAGVEPRPAMDAAVAVK